jgi:hypothetical protein
MICASLALLQIMFAVHRFRSGGDSACGAEGWGLPQSGNAYKISVTGFTFSVIWHNKHSGD